MKVEHKGSKGSLISLPMEMESPTEARGDDFKPMQNKAETGTKLSVACHVDFTNGDHDCP